MMIPVSEKYLRVNKPDKLKISATLSAMCNSLALIPNKVLTALKEKLKDINERTIVKILVFEDSSFELQLTEKTDAQVLKKILKENPINYESELEQYAKLTLKKSYAESISTRVKELKGIIKSMQKKQ